ncbi:ABC transporter substrate-binding protein [Oceanotoga sp. DSM 15011]|uniref:ABC transporter substrate-binding protein n=1 Tax=Oceanotoga sp. DSM 15011 TaxID=2984951 RepID=UPI0021F3E894|nr:ABC transporter substrate-binding protein [Oceanotoga sp. DSM 15011]UYO99313.1 ABC transporter substrate-binding protein [Oceanotoga sp. DSM 15011]
MKKLLVISMVIMISLFAFSKDFVVKDMFTPETPKLGGRVTTALSSAPQSFNLYGTLDNAAYTIIPNVLSPLVEANPITNEIEPGLAESWDVSADGKEVTFHLRDVKWSDGVQFNANDVIFTLDYFVMNKFAEGNSIARYTINGELVKWEKVDNMTVKATLPAPYGAFFTVLAQAPIYPEHKVSELFNKNDLGSVNKIWTTDTNVKDIVSTGPYLIDNYVVDQKVILKRNPNFWKVDKWGNRLPYVDTFEYLIVKDAEVAMAKFMAGEIDYIKVNSKDYPVLKQKELQGADFVIFRGQPSKPTPSPLHITFNFDAKNDSLKELFRNDKFRQAMEYALDRDRIIDEVYNTLAVYGGVPVLPSNKGFYNPKIEEIRRSFNLTKASKMLDELGLKDIDNDGIREMKNGEDLSIVLLTKTTQEFQDIAYLYSEDLKNIGVKMNLQILDAGLQSQKALSGDFEMSLWAFGNQPDPQLRKAIWQPGNPLYYNHLSTMDSETRTAVKSEMYDWELEVWNMFEKGQTEMNIDQRKSYYDKWQEIYAEKVPFIFVCKGMDLMGAQNSVGNFYQMDDGTLVYLTYTVFDK